MFDFFFFHPQEDEKFLTELFAQLTDGKSEEIRRKELVLFLKEFCTFAQALQPPGRESFFKTLNNLGILQALEITLQVAVSFQLLLVLIIFFIITVLF
jgi:protein phosphatase-4 regulatory subunit 3